MGALTLAIILAATHQPSAPGRVPAPHRFYAQAGPVVTRDAAGTPNHRIQPPLAGHALGITAAAGYAYSPSGAIEIELAWAGGVSTRQVFSYNWREEYRTENIDRFLNVLARWTPSGGGISIVGGGGLTSTTVNQRDGVRTEPLFFPNRPPSRLPDQSSRYVALTLTGGVDAEIPLTSRVLLVPTVRGRWVNRPNDGQSAYAGVGAYVFQGGISFRASF